MQRREGRMGEEMRKMEKGERFNVDTYQTKKKKKRKKVYISCRLMMQHTATTIPARLYMNIILLSTLFCCIMYRVCVVCERGQ